MLGETDSLKIDREQFLLDAEEVFYSVDLELKTDCLEKTHLVEPQTLDRLDIRFDALKKIRYDVQRSHNVMGDSCTEHFKQVILKLQLTAAVQGSMIFYHQHNAVLTLKTHSMRDDF